MKLGIMLSGSGSTYGCIADAIEDGRLPVEVALVISSKAKAGGVDRAKAYSHRCECVDVNDPGHHDEISQKFMAAGVDLIVMAGYMHLWALSPELEGKVINVHPSLIPAFCGQGMYGKRVHRAAVAKGVKYSGCTIHLVDGEYDHGKILEQRVVNVESTDTPDSLSAKVQLAEKSLLLHVIRHWDFYKTL